MRLWGAIAAPVGTRHGVGLAVCCSAEPSVNYAELPVHLLLLITVNLVDGVHAACSTRINKLKDRGARGLAAVPGSLVSV